MRISKNKKIIRDRILEIASTRPEILEKKCPFDLFMFEGFFVEKDIKISYIEVIESMELAKKKYNKDNKRHIL